MDYNFENKSDSLLPVKSFQEICRTCLVVDKLFNIKNVNVEGTNLLDIISSSIQFENSPELPQNMCMNCIRKFYEIDRFLKECVQTQTFLRNILSNQNTVNVEEEKVTNEYCEYIVDTNLLRTQEIPTDEEDEAASDNFENENFQETIILQLDDTEIELEKPETVTKLTYHRPNKPSFLTNDLDAIVLKKHEIPIEKNKTSDNVIDTIICETKAIPTEEHKTNVIGTIVLKTQETPTEKGEDEIVLDLPNNCEIKKFQETILNFLKSDEVGIKTEIPKTGHVLNKFACKFCGRGFNYEHKYIQHLRTHTGERPFSCQICKRRFGDRSTTYRHFLTHSNSRKHLCPTCGKGFLRKENLRNHERKQHGAEKLLCTFCGKEFADYGLFWRHKREKHLNKEIKLDPSIPFQCKVCGKIYANEKLLQEHENNHVKKQKPKPPKPLKNSDEKSKTCECKHCQTKFPNKRQLRFHLLDSECTKLATLYPCSECSLVSISKVSWQSHKYLHAEEKKNETYDCKICGKVFDKKTFYRNHCREHTKERKFGCSECGMCFKAERHLTTHRRTHTGEKPYTCDVCNKSFIGKGNLNKHKLIHIELKPYKCDTCGHEFRDFYDLKKHVKLRHPEKLSYFMENASNLLPR